MMRRFDSGGVRSKARDVTLCGAFLALIVIMLFGASFGFGPDMVFMTLSGALVYIAARRVTLGAGIALFVASFLLSLLLLPEKIIVCFWALSFAAVAIVCAVAGRLRGQCSFGDAGGTVNFQPNLPKLWRDESAGVDAGFGNTQGDEQESQRDGSAGVDAGFGNAQGDEQKSRIDGSAYEFGGGVGCTSGYDQSLRGEPVDAGEFGSGVGCESVGLNAKKNKIRENRLRVFLYYLVVACSGGALFCLAWVLLDELFGDLILGQYLKDAENAIFVPFEVSVFIVGVFLSLVNAFIFRLVDAFVGKRLFGVRWA